jgi:hypothetical protein
LKHFVQLIARALNVLVGDPKKLGSDSRTGEARDKKR